MKPQVQLRVALLATRSGLDFVAKRAALSATRRTTTYATTGAALQTAGRTIRQLLGAAIQSLLSVGRDPLRTTGTGLPAVLVTGRTTE
jgi:hypothetical protein